MYEIKLNNKLDLDNTLFSGQAFRWYKKGDWYYGYINNVFIRLRKKNNFIEYENSQKIIFESEIKNYFDLDNDYSNIFLELNDKNASLAFQSYEGMKVLNQDPWECLISFIISAWSNVPKISKSINELCLELGDKQVVGSETGYIFPSPNIISNVNENYLRKFALGYRSKYVLATSKMLNNNLNLIYDLFNYEYDNALNELLKFPGVGDKVANCVLIYSLKKSFAFPVDLWVERILVDDYKLEKKVPLVKKRKWAQNHFGKYSGIIQHFLFHYKRKYNH
ncbi:MAG: DNA glycosylase [Dehalococcoidia bacterium]